MVVAVSLTDKEGVVPRHHTGVLVGMARGHIAPSSLSGGWSYPENLVWSGKGLML